MLDVKEYSIFDLVLRCLMLLEQWLKSWKDETNGE